MIDFSKYTLQELQAIVSAFDTMLDYICEHDLTVGWVFHEYGMARLAVEEAVKKHAREHEAAEAEKVNHIKEACIASAPPAEEPDDLQALVDTLSRCSDRLAALALAEDEHFAECSETEVFNKVTMLKDCKQALNNMVSDIRDHYDRLH